MTVVAARAARSAAGARRRVVALPLVLWLAGAAISGFTLRRYIGPVDEGILMQAATRMGDGQWPWRDFSWAYGPGEPLVVMAAGKLLGPSLLWWRLLRVAADATAALLVWSLVRDERPRWALAAWAAAAVTAAQPVSANPAGPALAFALGAVLLASRRHPAWAGMAAAAAGFWRPDMGAAAALAAAATAALAARRDDRGGAAGRADRGGAARGPDRGGAAGRGGRGGAAGRADRGGAAGRGGRGGAARGSDRGGAAGRGGRGTAAGPRAGPRAAVAVLAVAGLAAAALYLPFLVAAGPGRVWDALVVQATRDGAWWRLPFPGGYSGSDALDFLRWLLPYAGLAAAGLAAVRPRRAAPSLAGLLILALGAIAYFVSRADAEHAQGLLVLVAAIAAIAQPKPLLGAILALLLLAGAANRASALLRPPDLEPLHVAGAGGVRVPPLDAASLPRLVARVQRLVPPGEPIYVAPARSDVAPFNDPLLHFLTRRPNVLHRDFLLQAKPEEQAKIVAALERARPKVVVRWLDPGAREPNLRGSSTGSRTLDQYLARAYRAGDRYGDYLILVPR